MGGGQRHLNAQPSRLAYFAHLSERRNGAKYVVTAIQPDHYEVNFSSGATFIVPDEMRNIETLLENNKVLGMARPNG